MQEKRLVEVTSNIWGTKFKFHGVASHLPANLGQVNYKTSLLHLQPRQMTLAITELRDDVAPLKDPDFDPNVFSEDEDDLGMYCKIFISIKYSRFRTFVITIKPFLVQKLLIKFKTFQNVTVT